MRETHPNILLERKAARLPSETGNKNFEARLHSHTSTRQVLLAAIVRPVKLLLVSPIVLILSLYVAFLFGLLYLLFTTFSTVFKGQYGFNEGTSGLAYLGLGFGELVGLVVFGVLTDRISRWRMATEKMTLPKPEYRLVLMVFHLWLDGLLKGTMDRTYHRDFFYRFRVLFYHCKYSITHRICRDIYFLPSQVFTDAFAIITCRCIWIRGCRLRTRSQHSIAFTFRNFSATRWAGYVRHFGLWIGEIHCLAFWL